MSVDEPTDRPAPVDPETFRGQQDARSDLAHPSGVMIAYFARRDPAWSRETEAYRRAYRATWEAERWAGMGGDADA